MCVGINRCKLSRKNQEMLLQFVTTEVTEQTAADLVGINRREAVLFYHKIRLVIAARLAPQAEEMFGEEIELDESSHKRPLSWIDKPYVFRKDVFCEEHF